jgi:hypothetical protein
MYQVLNGWCPHGVPGAVGCAKCESAAEENRVAALQTTNSHYVTALRSVLLDDKFTYLQVADILHRVELRLHAEERHDT